MKPAPAGFTTAGARRGFGTLPVAVRRGSWRRHHAETRRSRRNTDWPTGGSPSWRRASRQVLNDAAYCLRERVVGSVLKRTPAHPWPRRSTSTIAIVAVSTPLFLTAGV